jgi:hypothetical protein
MHVEQDEIFFNVDFSYLENDWEKDSHSFNISSCIILNNFDGDDAPTDEALISIRI